jgi:hypothetical protein
MDQIDIQEYYIHRAPMTGRGSKFSCMKKGGTDEECKEEEEERPLSSLSDSLESSPAPSRTVSPTNVSLNLFRSIEQDKPDKSAETFDQMMERMQLRARIHRSNIQKPKARNVFRETNKKIEDIVKNFEFTKGLSQRKSKR